MRNKNPRRKLSLGQETIAKLELALVAGGVSSDSGEGITRPGMASCWTCFLTHCCAG
jgi:hypothetical protein